MYTHCHPRVPFKGSGGKDLSTNAPRLRAPCHMNTRWPTERLSLSSVFTVTAETLQAAIFTRLAACSLTELSLA